MHTASKNGHPLASALATRFANKIDRQLPIIDVVALLRGHRATLLTAMIKKGLQSPRDVISGTSCATLVESTSVASTSDLLTRLVVAVSWLNVVDDCL